MYKTKEWARKVDSSLLQTEVYGQEMTAGKARVEKRRQERQC